MTAETHTDGSPRVRGQDLWWSAGLFVLTVLSRLPFQSRVLYHWDSVNFAYAMREFSVIKEQPQPPGYIVYVWLCRLVDLIFHDANRTMIAIAILSSGLTVVALYWLGKAMFGRWIGAVSALLMWSSPLFWFYGEIALPHALDALLATVGVWWLYEVMCGDVRFLYPAIVVLSIAAGVRQQTIVFLGPLILFALWRVGWRRFVAAGALGMVLCLAWFIPLVASSGGLAPYMGKVGEFSRRFQTTTSLFAGAGWFGLQRNVTKLTLYTAYGWGVAAVPFLVGSLRRLGRREWPTQWKKLAFLVLWVVPTVAFYVVVHMGQQGLVFVYLPALMLVGACGLMHLLRGAPRSVGTVVVVVLLIVHAAIFVLSPEYPLNTDRLRLLNRIALVRSDEYYMQRFAAIQGGFQARATAILAANWQHVEYYLPGYPVLHLGVIAKWELGEGEPIGDQPTKVLALSDLFGTSLDQGFIVVFDPVLEPLNASPERAQAYSLPSGETLSYLTLAGGERFRYGDGSYGIAGD